jgi:hypothetical protein
MDRVKKPGLKELMPKVASMVAGRRSDWGDAHVTDCVTRGMRGEANQFYAFEAGRIVGTPFDNRADLDEMIKLGAMLDSAAFMAMRPPVGGGNGQN